MMGAPMDPTTLSICSEKCLEKKIRRTKAIIGQMIAIEILAFGSKRGCAQRDRFVLPKTSKFTNLSPSVSVAAEH